MRLLLGAVADDFTGATDLASMLSRAGMRTTLVLGAPDLSADVPEAEAVVVALKSRTAPVDQAVSESVESWRWLSRAGAQQCYFKYCSTFDSTPQGNIGPVAEALRKFTKAEVTIYCPAFPENGRTVYQGKLFVFDQLLSESGMASHPLTPMTDADLRRVLAAQLPEGSLVGFVPWNVVSRGADAIRSELTQASIAGFRHVIVDAVRDEDLIALGRACAGAKLVTGGSGLGLGLPENFASAGELEGGEATTLPHIDGPTLILSGSCSTATNAQVARWEREGGPILRLEPLLLAETGPGAALEWALEQLNGDAAVLISSSQTPDQVQTAQERLGPDRATELVEGALAEIAKAARARGVRRFVVAGGETSGAVAQALGVSRMTVGPSIAPGVPWCASLDEEPVALALKSGNFGGEGFFADALAAGASAT
ncbi:MAG: four-carbon acid sugar kinase family protein [Rhodobacteraceae bacterium]|nr:four-carbon acid sugar kinase family protein [Paracoccaceae bacterium]